MRELTDRQDLFVREYLVDLNATAAAGRAGYSDPNYGRQLIAKPNVAAAISMRQGERAKRTEVTADRVLQELARIGFADVSNLFEWDEERAAFVPSRDLTADESAAVSAVKAETTHYTREDGTLETKIKLELKTHDKLGALREIGKHLGIADKVEHSGQIGTGVLAVPASHDDWDVIARRMQATPAPNGEHGGPGNGNGRG